MKLICLDCGLIFYNDVVCPLCGGDAEIIEEKK